MHDFDLDARAPATRRAPARADGDGSTAVMARAMATRHIDRMRPADLLHLQRMVGNAGMTQLLQRQGDGDGPPIETGAVEPEPAEEVEGGGDAGGCC